MLSQAYDITRRKEGKNERERERIYLSNGISKSIYDYSS
jgi:hypothetical protein